MLTESSTSTQLTEGQLGIEIFDLVERSSGRKRAHTTSRGRAVLYLRVSTKRQVSTDYDPEGISLPAQRKACETKARQLGMDVIDEYVEPGRSGTEMSKRVAFNSIVYKLSRMNRSRYDDADVMRVLEAHDVVLISATEGIDGTPVGKLMHGVLASFNQYRSEEDGADIRYKLGEKAKRGGTISRAPIGYINVGERFEDREVRTVKHDPERASYIPLAFELYASNEYSFQDLSDELYDRGLRTRATSRNQPAQLMPQQIGRLLRDPYYLGFVSYNGEKIPGRHAPLVSQELFDRVQDIITSRELVDERQRQHSHYLKGTL
jgi:site-specific DNA recombinase